VWDYGTVAICALAALCLSKWAWEADYPNFSTETVGNGFGQGSFGRGARKLAPPACYRLLFPCLVYPDRSEAPYETPEFSWPRWIWYQSLRFLVILTGLLILTASVGIPITLVSGALFGLTLRFDYWSNAVEFLAVGCVIAGGVFGWHWGACLAIGIVLGTGRETLPFLALVGTPQAVSLGAGAAIGQVAVRCFVRTEAHWKDALEYATPMWRTNWDSLRGIHGANYQWCIGIYLLVALLAATTVPLLAVSLVLVTALVARIDEPRVLTMLTPFAAIGAMKWL